MSTLVPLLLIALAPPAPQARGEQMQAFEARRAGRLMPLREIERRVVPQMPDAQYLGFEFDAEQLIYTLKFLRDGHVIWVDVDGHNGQVLRRTGQ